MAAFKVINGVVTVDKEITKLDEFALKLLAHIRKATDYVIIRGYVSIFFGRARGTEDIDISIKDLPYERFKRLYADTVVAGYGWTVTNPKALYHDYLQKGLPVSVWEKDFPLLRIEMKIASTPGRLLAFTDRLAVRFKSHDLFMAGIEGQIAYKRYIAKSEKDLADARHLELVFEHADGKKSGNAASSSSGNSGGRSRAAERWAAFVRERPDREWSKLQKGLIDSQLENARRVKLSKGQVRKIRGR